ncbi:hypothetical protein MRX96_048683 [Rhipicephalus microplus]
MVQVTCSWEAAEKRAFRLGARSFYIKCTEYLLSRLPLDNTNLESLRCLHPDAQGRETSACDLRLLAARLPQVIEASKISALMDEFTFFQLEPIETFSLSVDQHWQKVFELKKADGSAKYPLLCKVIKALLCIPHGNADLERGLSENRRMLLERAHLTIHNVNGIRQILSHAKRFGGDPSKFVVTPTIIEAVQGSSKRYRERIAAEESVAKRRCTDSSKSPEKDDAEQAVQAEVETAKKMICNAELLIGRGVKSKDFGDIETSYLSAIFNSPRDPCDNFYEFTCADWHATSSDLQQYDNADDAVTGFAEKMARTVLDGVVTDSDLRSALASLGLNVSKAASVTASDVLHAAGTLPYKLDNAPILSVELVSNPWNATPKLIAVGVFALGLLLRAHFHVLKYAFGSSPRYIQC